MADIFISYASEDRDKVKPLAKALETQGWTVFWDFTIPVGKTWRQVITGALDDAKCAVVVWSSTSINSEWVHEEAEEAQERHILVPAMIDKVKPPLGFRRMQAARLMNWTGNSNHPEFEKLLKSIEAILGPSPLKVREEQKHRAVKKESKPSKPEPDAIKPSEPRKKSNALKFGVIAGVIILLITGVWLYYNNQGEQHKKDARIKLEKFYEQIEELERSVAKADNQEKLKGLYRRRDKLSDQIAAFSEQSTRIGLQSQLDQLQDRLRQLDVQLTKREKELNAGQKGKIFVASTPDNATIKILNIDEPFQQGIELDPGKYHLQVSSEGYEPQDRRIELGPGETSRIILTLKKIPSKVGKLFVETVPKDATVKILNIRPKFSQGMELEPGYYHVEVSAQGYKTERRYIDLEAGNEEPFRFELTKIKAAEPISPQKTITNSIGMKFVLIPAGSFTMGRQLSQEEVAKRYGGEAKWFKDEHPPHPVKITKPFYLQTTEISQGHWKWVMGDNPSYFKDCGDDCPVEQVSWDDAQKFIRKLNHIEGTNKYRLPTEAEWEYACRAGTTTPFFTGECISTDQANYNGSSPGENCPKGQYRRKTVKVGSFQPNAWGLYDMHGNVREWCQDWFGDYPSDSVADPKGPGSGQYRVFRGGSWNYGARLIRSAERGYSLPGHRNDSRNGFRVTRDF
jgi:formylglycine-generating enzyme required for sulfatase activity